MVKPQDLSAFRNIVLVAGSGGDDERDPSVGQFVTEHEAGVAGVGSSAPKSAVVGSAAQDMPTVASRLELVAVIDHGMATQALYSDGTEMVSVFREVGELDWNAVPQVATAVEVDGDPGALIDQGENQVLVFQRGDFVYTIVAPARTGVFNDLGVALPRREHRTLASRLKDAGTGLVDCLGLRG